MDLKKTMIRSLAALAASALPLGLGAQAASAEGYNDTDAVDWTFQRESNGEEVTCQVVAGSYLFRTGTSGLFTAGASTVTNAQPDYCRARLGVTFSYLDPRGTPRQGTSFADTAFSVDWSEENVAGQLVVQHSFNFIDCSEDCGAEESAMVTQPK